MPSGRHPLEPQAKAARRQATLENYAHKNRERLRDAARNMQPTDLSAANGVPNPWMKKQDHREAIRKADRQRREDAARVRAEAAQAIKPLAETTIYGVYGAQACQILGDPRGTAPRRPRPATVSNQERRRKSLEIDMNSPRARPGTITEPLIDTAPPNTTARRTSTDYRRPKGLKMPANLDDLLISCGYIMVLRERRKPTNGVAEKAVEWGRKRHGGASMIEGNRGLEGEGFASKQIQANTSKLLLLSLSPLGSTRRAFVQDSTPWRNCVSEHNADPGLFFFGIVSGGPTGVYSSYDQIKALLRDLPDAVYFQAKNWEEAEEKWEQHCTEAHNHWDEWEWASPPVTPSPVSSPPSTPSPVPSAFTVSPRSSRTGSPCSFFADSGPPPHAPPAANARTPSSSRRAKVTHTTPGASPTKSQATTRVAQASPGPSLTWPSQLPRPKFPMAPMDNIPSQFKDHFDRVSAAYTARFEAPPSPELSASAPLPARHEAPLFPEPPGSAHFPERLASMFASPPSRDLPAFAPSRELPPRAPSPELPAVDLDIAPPGYSGALEVFREASPPFVYALSDHPIVFRNRNNAFDLFQARRATRPALEMLVTQSAQELRAFLLRHWANADELVFSVSADHIVRGNLDVAFELLQAGDACGEMLVTKDVRKVERFFK
ncbi:hypothetical protein C8F04DRAFT_1193767 [Mycena alexandri]|uniref:Uncharacterized protein n=1 Tax=Mycena alexandri TaxID=1745969 RepID=A0AAD6WRZ4_9AGAR|nr:hypothetical protein C8F04DRAFT_1193767 [Mycena alexandri]